MKKIILILIIITLPKHIMFGQGGFNKNYTLSGSYVSVCTDVTEAPNGNIIMTGLTYDTPTGSNRLTILGADAQGNQLWCKNYGSDKFEYLDNSITKRSLINDNNGFYFYTVVRDSNNKYFSAFIKFNYNGDTLWQKKYYDAMDYLYIQSVTKSVDNGFLITGFFEGTTNRTTLIIKTDNNGKELWRKKISKTIPNIQAGNAIVQDTVSKQIILAGYQANGTANAYEYYANIIICDSLGNELQRKYFSKGCGSIFTDLIQTKDKKCVVVGQNNQCNNSAGGFSRNKSYAVKFDLNNLNNVSWIKEFDTLSVYNYFATVNELKTGDLILSGSLDTLWNYGNKQRGMLRLIKLDKNGNLKWKKLYSRDTVTANSKGVRSMNVTQNGSYLVSCELYWASNPRPYSISRIDSTGCDSTSFYCNPVGINELKIKDEGLKIFPNPFTNQLTVNTTTNELKKLIITNLLGQTVYQTEFYQNSITVDLPQLQSGAYLSQLYVNGIFSYRSKLIKE